MDNIEITRDGEFLRLDLSLRGAAAYELLELADWLDSRGWDLEAEAVRLTTAEVK